ncbi:carboxymuconolactone decarboxylase family protein [Kordiimonas aestuarii]|uniref:carboxymuconolactone decarboxylase family protein n=1 Tax=Kordiimonas aestuarii TaxID=1005925 RepID=UPI0021D3A001|nr:carboxymuconolactone decarboxylase family protein [Kordiimonas aestuarii]
MSQTAPVNIYHHGKTIISALAEVEKLIAETNIDESLRHLLKLRASQMNGCGYCVKMHTTDARRHGESNERLDRLVVWRHVNDFTDREKAAFAYIEALTELKPDARFADHRARLREHFSDEDITALTALSAMINLWNRIQVSQH